MFLHSFGDTAPLSNHLVSVVAAVLASPLPRRIEQAVVMDTKAKDAAKTYDEQVAATIGSVVDRIMTILSNLSLGNINLFKGHEREWTTVFEHGLLHEAINLRYAMSGKISSLIATWNTETVCEVLKSLLTLIQGLKAVSFSQKSGPFFMVTRDAFKILKQRNGSGEGKTDSNSNALASAFIDCLASKLREHPILERSSNGSSDTMLSSMISLANLIISIFPQFKIVAGELGIMDSVCQALFALPQAVLVMDTKSLRLAQAKTEGSTKSSCPAAKMPITRAEATNLILSLVRDCPPNLHILFSYFNPLLQEAQNDHAYIPEWNYAAPPLIERVGGNIGLKNARFLCYMNSALQLIYMMPELRQAILRADMGPLTRTPSVAPTPPSPFFRSSKRERGQGWKRWKR